MVLASVLAAPLPAAAGTAPPWLGLVDARHPDQPAVLYALPGGEQAAPPKSLPFVRLDGATPRIECCLRAGAVRAAPAGAAAQLRQADGGSRPLEARTARTPKSRHGAVLLAVAGGAGLQVERPSPQTLLLRRPGETTPLAVRHCVSGDGLQLRWTLPGGQPQQAWLPLGMDVEADCPPEMLAPAR